MVSQLGGCGVVAPSYVRLAPVAHRSHCPSACPCPPSLPLRRLQPSCGNAAAFSRLTLQSDGGNYNRYLVRMRLASGWCMHACLGLCECVHPVTPLPTAVLLLARG